MKEEREKKTVKGERVIDCDRRKEKESKEDREKRREEKPTDGKSCILRVLALRKIVRLWVYVLVLTQRAPSVSLNRSGLVIRLQWSR